MRVCVCVCAHAVICKCLRRLRREILNELLALMCAQQSFLDQRGGDFDDCRSFEQLVRPPLEPSAAITAAEEAVKTRLDL